MRFRLGGWAVAAVLVLAGCGGGGGPDEASPAVADRRGTELPGPELASARDTLPPAPSSTTTLTVLLTHPDGASDPGLDAAAAALAQRPDIRVVVAVPGTASGASRTMSGFPVSVVAPGPDGLVAGVVAATGTTPDLVVVGIDRAAVLGGTEPLASTTAASGTPTLVVEAEDGEVVDHAAAAMQLLELLDLHLDALVEAPAAVHRLTVPSCRAGSLRGRLDVEATTAPTTGPGSDCTSTDRNVPSDELVAVTAGYAALTRLS